MVSLFFLWFRTLLWITLSTWQTNWVPDVMSSEMKCYSYISKEHGISDANHSSKKLMLARWCPCRAHHSLQPSSGFSRLRACQWPLSTYLKAAFWVSLNQKELSPCVPGLICDASQKMETSERPVSKAHLSSEQKRLHRNTLRAD